MNKINLSRQMDTIIAENENQGKKPTLLLHCCCAPCSSSVLEQLCEHFYVTVYFYNPNIFPQQEYDYRLAEMKRLLTQQRHSLPVRLLEAPYQPSDFFVIAEGLENAPEGGQRCRKCFYLRLEKTAQMAKELGFDYFTTTLSVSPLKNATVLYETACLISQIYGVPALPSDFKKKNGYLRSIVLSKEFQLYRQNYCGCIYSKKQADNKI